jgi:hypothetical protein
VIGRASVALARHRDWLYLNRTERRAAAMPPPLAVHPDGRMAEPISTSQVNSTVQPSRKLAAVIVAGGAGLGVVLLLSALGLWFHYGTAVFFEMIVSGLSACF